MEWIVIVVAISCFIIWLIKNGVGGIEPPTLAPYERQKALLTPAERSFYGVLLHAIDAERFVVFSKVRVADVLKPIGGLDRSQWQIAFNKISAKHFDFVLCDVNTLAVEMVIELDDRSHQKKGRVARDVFLDEACEASKLNLVRIPAQRAYRIDEVRILLFGNTESHAVNASTPSPAAESIMPRSEGQYSVFDLHMSPEGFAKASAELKAAHRSDSQIFIHVGVKGDLKDQVIMIGRAKNGTYNRWMQSVNGHKSTFLWATGESDRYTRKNAETYPKYLLFFASLFNQQTKLCVLDVSQEDMVAMERQLTKEYGPIWEQYRDTIKYSKSYPALTGKGKNEAIVQAIAQIGAARKLIKAQRKLDDGSMKRLPDVMSMELKSKKEWV